MRLFIAIDLDKHIKEELLKIILHLKHASKQGSYTLQENLHLTLIFLGEVEASKIGVIRAAMDEPQTDPFELEFTGSGRFQRKEGDIYWIGVNNNKDINDIYHQIFRELTGAGFQLEKRPFKPHLTIGRRIVPGEGFNMAEFNKLIPTMKMEVSKISLMKSERINGKLTYTEMYRKIL